MRGAHNGGRPRRTGVAFLNVATHAQKIGNATDAVIAVRAAGVRAAHEQCATRSDQRGALSAPGGRSVVDVERTVPGPVPESGYEYS